MTRSTPRWLAELITRLDAGIYDPALRPHWPQDAPEGSRRHVHALKIRIRHKRFKFSILMKNTLALFALLLSVSSLSAQADYSTLLLLPGPTPAGGASAFALAQQTSSSNDTAPVTNVVTSSAIGAGRLQLIWAKWENAGVSLTNVSERGGGNFTALTARSQETGALLGQWFYRLSSTGGSTNIDLQWSNSGGDFNRVIYLEFTYGGTCSFVTEANNGADTGTAMTGAAASNSGTHRLNVCGYGGFNGATITSPQIGGVAGDVEPNTQVSDTWSWWNAEQLSSENATGTRSSSEGWILSLACFAAN